MLTCWVNNQYNKANIQFFFAFLLVVFATIGYLHFHLGASMGLILKQTIGDVVLVKKEVVIDYMYLIMPQIIFGWVL